MKLTNQFDHPDRGWAWRECELRWINDRIEMAVKEEREACAKICDLMAEVLLARSDDAMANGNTGAALTLARQSQTATDLGESIRTRSNA